MIEGRLFLNLWHYRMYTSYERNYITENNVKICLSKILKVSVFSRLGSRDGAPDCLCQWVHVLDTGCLISVPRHRPSFLGSIALACYLCS